MITGNELFLLVFGILACFMGYSMFRSMLPMWGFILGGWITYTMLPSILPLDVGSELLYALLTFAVGGLVGAIIAVPLYFVIIFLSGGALGMLLGIMTGALLEIGGISSIRQISEFTAMAFPPMPETGLQFLLMAVFGVILGGLSLNFQKFMICASSSFLGAAAIVSGLIGPITQITTTDAGRGATMVTAWLLIGLIGMYIQFRMMGEV